ncbi:MAG: hypothetical protein RMM58_08940 [Chloroflexota bacterium]|nr:hypothetical protein [Dehalococcoidia bacterium]MDW8253991.1 hypothetical protein [Chloroflexota bacterium]
MIETLAELRATETPGLPFRIRLTEADAVDLITRQAAQGAPLPVSGIALELRPQAVTLSLEVSVIGMAMTVHVRGLPRLKEERLIFEFHEMRLNGSPAPPFLQHQVVQQVNERLAPDALPLVIDSVEIGEGWVVLSGRTK